ncbi:MAG: site-specific DNA-methyltransferase, partial [Deltaproteobacteria bacterium]|nr:site-specific DNA-methyltransferase [Deltaproteobacteria bacterium]
MRRELDFYIKNEVMRLDDIESADVPTVESYLTKIRILRKISHKIIDFLAQLEDFQKKLWLKKKFVVETNYCITLDRIPEELYPEIADNEAQRKEWVKLFAIDEIKGDLHTRKYSKPLTVKFLKENQFLVLDTRFFDEEFKERLIASIDDFDEQCDGEQCDGLLIHSENFQALNLLQERYREQVKCIYIDPPYNTGDGDFNYKDSYQHSSWLSLLENRIIEAGKLHSPDGAFFCNIDDNEFSNLKNMIDNLSIYRRFVANIIWKHTEQSKNDEINFSRQWNYITCYGMPKLGKFRLPRTNEDNKNYSNPDSDPKGDWRSGDVRSPNFRKTLCYNIETPSGRIIPPPKNGWRWSKDQVQEKIATGEIVFSQDEYRIIRKIYLCNQEGRTPENLWIGERFGTTRSATNDLKVLFTASPFDTPKPKDLIQRIIELFENHSDLTLLDYFAGSGTTAHAVINLNREDNGHRKYILVEMGDYFDTVLKPRIQKVIYSESWKNGKPTARGTGVSHCFKYLRLESYEDTLNNLSFNNNSKAYQDNPNLYEDYMLRYLLDVETRGSQSLLNIDAFADPCAYKLKVKQPGSDEYVVKNVDLLETFNYLIGLRVAHIAAPLAFTAKFKREPDPELPENQQTRLVVDGRIKQDKNGPWWFRKVEGWIPSDPSNPNNGQKENVLIVWRKLTGNLEQNNLMLDEWFQKNRISTRDFEFDTIYVNGSNNLPNLKLDDENWKVRLIEEEFMKRMWDVEG